MNAKWLFKIFLSIENDSEASINTSCIKYYTKSSIPIASLSTNLIRCNMHFFIKIIHNSKQSIFKIHPIHYHIPTKRTYSEKRRRSKNKKSNTHEKGAYCVTYSVLPGYVQIYVLRNETNKNWNATARGLRPPDGGAHPFVWGPGGGSLAALVYLSYQFSPAESAAHFSTRLLPLGRGSVQSYY